MKWKKWTELLYDRRHKKGTVLIDTYRIEECLGMGGYGITYLCREKGTKQSYVVKQLRPSKARKLKEKRRFRSEVEIMKKMAHPQIPQFIDHFTIEAQAYYVMQRIKGRNLEDVLFKQKQTFTELQALLLMDKLVTIVEYLHEKYIFHNDMRPPNIIVNDQRIYVIDFGLAEQIPPENKKKIQMKKEDDFYDLGECLLFILYSQYTGKKSKNKSWLEELTLHDHTVFLLKRLLGIEKRYDHTSEVREDLHRAIKAL